MRYALLARLDTDGETASRPWGSPLRGPSDATTLRIEDGRLRVPDGPFPDEAGPGAGLDVIEADDLEAAVDAAAAHPAARGGAVEVREVWADFAGSGEPARPASGAGRRYLFLHTNPAAPARRRGGGAATAAARARPPGGREAQHPRRAVLDGNRLRPADVANSAV